MASTTTVSVRSANAGGCRGLMGSNVKDVVCSRSTASVPIRLSPKGCVLGSISPGAKTVAIVTGQLGVGSVCVLGTRRGGSYVC